MILCFYLFVFKKIIRKRKVIFFKYNKNRKRNVLFDNNLKSCKDYSIKSVHEKMDSVIKLDIYF